MRLQFIILFVSFINFCYSSNNEIKIVETKDGLYALNKKGSLYVNNIKLNCTVQIKLYQDGWDVYKTIYMYPVEVYRIDQSKHGHVTYWLINDIYQNSVDISACKDI